MNPRYKPPIAPIQYRIEWNPSFRHRIRYGFYAEDDFRTFLSPVYNSKTSAINLIPGPPSVGDCRPICNVNGCNQICTFAIPRLKVHYYIEQFQRQYRKCTRPPRLCLCPPHRKDHYCLFDIRSIKGVIGPDKNKNKQTIKNLLADKNFINGNYQIKAVIDGFGKTKYNGVIFGLNNCGTQFPQDFGFEPLRPKCLELGFNLNNITLYDSRPPTYV